MKLKFTSILLASLIAGSSSCYNSSKACEEEIALCAIGGGALILGAGIIGLGIYGCTKIKIKHYSPCPKDPEQEYNKLRNYGMHIANSVTNRYNNCDFKYTISTFDNHLLSYIDSLVQLDYYRIQSAINNSPKKEPLQTNCAYYNEVRVMISHLKTAIKCIESSYFDPASLDAVMNLKNLKHSMEAVSKRKYNDYKRFAPHGPKKAVYVEYY